MSLPIRTTIADVSAICAYLVTKPTGATVSEAKAVLDSSILDGRKVSAYRTWGLIEDNGEKMRLTERGRNIARDKGARKAPVLRDIVSSIAPYRAAIERAVHRNDFAITAPDLAAHWYEHFRNEVSENDKILNDQAVCFFQLAEGADLGTVIVGRKGQPTRLELDEGNARAFAESEESSSADIDPTFSDQLRLDDVQSDQDEIDPRQGAGALPPAKATAPGNKVFITHGKNSKILNQVKEIVAFGKFEPIVAKDRETTSKPVPDKVMDDMRQCQAAVLHVGVEQMLLDADGNQVAQINGNVLIEVGAAMALYGRNFILLVEEGVQLPSNLQGLYECRYSGDELSMAATMKLLKAFNDFTLQT